MAGEPGTRRLLPQSSQMQSFAFAPANFGPGPRENQKNYVFVDEHNRHKRLKVMRACEGCRRRKIKCDAATTNTWPCSACIRLKLHCVPPTVNYDRDFPNNPQVFEQERGDYDSGGSADDDYHHQISMQQHLAGPQKNIPPIYTQHQPYQEQTGAYHSVPYGEPQSSHTQQSMHYGSIHTPVSALDPHQHYTPQQQQHTPIFPTPPVTQPSHAASISSPTNYGQDQYGQENLADLLGDLKMDPAGRAPYYNNKSKNKSMVEEPAFEDIDEYKDVLPTTLSGPGLKVRIPPELMPDEETVLHYFDMYFLNVHPYVPVLNKTLFYQQWHTNREAISPLILEAIFAIAGRLADEPAQGQQWLALASKHADSFMDTPRLSTLQAMLIVLKAREAAPKRGYYYRSWITVVQCVQMAKDLGLDDHYEEHKAGIPCGSDLADCITKSRIWQTIFVCELMIGSPQGRTDLAVGLDTLDLSIPRPVPGIDESEFHVTRNFTYLTKLVRNVRRMNNIYARVKNKKEWGIDPEFVQLNPSFTTWMSDLPGDLQITFPPDGSAPWLPSHFIGNIHSYYHLGIIMLHRPQLTFMEPTGVDGGWKHHMMICYSASKLLCRLQEAILQSFGMTGLLCMQRGINFSIYAILTCTVLHLVALTSPDPDLNTDAREYFTRHMRILEKCTGSWPMADMQHQIDALREAFSADTRKAFVLKASFPYGSPVAPANTTPPRNGSYRQGTSHSIDQQSMDNHHSQQVSYQNHPISPPISAGGVDTKSDSPAVQSLVMMASGQRPAPQQQPPMSNGVQMAEGWNPAVIFDRWNTTFGSQEIPSLPHLPHSVNVNLPLPPNGAAPQQYSGAPMPSFVSPSMWQESVASVYEGGLKRQWDYDGEINTMSKRTR